MATFKSMLWTTTKLAAAGATICAVAWIVGVYQPDGSIKESQADILDLSFIELSNSARFARGLDQLGHDHPQSFSINGNVVHFSVNYSRKRPSQLMKEYQEEFVRQGINEKVWDAQNARGTGNQMLFEAMTGGVVPTMVSEDYVALGGVIPANDAQDEEGLAELGKSQEPKHDKVFKGHHYVEMFWDRQKRRSSVTATWSDENFDYRRMLNGGSATGEADVDIDVPSCPGCSRVSRVRDLDPTRSYSSNIFAGERQQSDLIDFYLQAMPRRGWSETESSLTFRTVRPYIEFDGEDASLLQFTKNGRFLTIVGYPGESGETVIHTVLSN